jgi:hypothetical protein
LAVLVLAPTVVAGCSFSLADDSPRILDDCTASALGETAGNELTSGDNAAGPSASDCVPISQSGDDVVTDTSLIND